MPPDAQIFGVKMCYANGTLGTITHVYEDGSCGVIWHADDQLPRLPMDNIPLHWLAKIAAPPLESTIAPPHVSVPPPPKPPPPELMTQPPELSPQPATGSGQVGSPAPDDLVERTGSGANAMDTSEWIPVDAPPTQPGDAGRQ